jgi:hypothetical protein
MLVSETQQVLVHMSMVPATNIHHVIYDSFHPISAPPPCLENADFTDAYIGDYDIRNLCKNPTLKVRTHIY